MAGIAQHSNHETEQETSKRSTPRLVMVVALALGVMGVGGYALSTINGLSDLVTPHFSTAQSSSTPTDPESKPIEPDVRLTREAIDALLTALDDAIRRKDVDGVVRYLTPDATVTIHLKQGPQQQAALLTREEYRKTLAMAFAFPSANDFTRTNTTVSMASDERSAKVSIKSTETLLQANREFKTEGEETLVFHIRGGKPMITSMEQTFPGDST